jgi:uncharacterized protein (DUF488 family)
VKSGNSRARLSRHERTSSAARSALDGRRYLHSRPFYVADRDTALAESLKAQHFEYVHLRALGGLRRARKDSPNTGWRNEGFRGFADYMQRFCGR